MSEDNKLPNINEFIKNEITKHNIFQSEYSEPVFECPICGNGVRRYENKVYCTNPPKHDYVCLNCGYNVVL